METDQLGRLRDILAAARLIGTYVKNTTETDFYADKQKQDAVIRRIEIIGEAAAHVTEASRQAVPELAFRKMRGMRNIVAHDYANVDLRIGWEVATVYVPEICTALEKFFYPPELNALLSRDRDFTYLEKADIDACLEYAARHVGHREILLTK